MGGLYFSRRFIRLHHASGTGSDIFLGEFGYDNDGRNGERLVRGFIRHDFGSMKSENIRENGHRDVIKGWENNICRQSENKTTTMRIKEYKEKLNADFREF